ncbi:MAG: 2-C-methyl-D-erythritol 4-phosphate cytidylyltransferase [Clostridia bacterium]|nr:2-C-methyl-D-erythritol 4-phosphate cytidylyltransferase [Clostridia bacterium]
MIIAAIVAGGSGTRMGSGLPKQFMELENEPVIVRTVKAFLAHSAVDAVIIGVNPAYYDYAKSLPGLQNKRVYITKGGTDRNSTIENIISYSMSDLHCSDMDIVLSHDAVRPFVSVRMIDDSINALNGCDICTASIPETDTVAVADCDMNACAFPDRSTLYRIQTPQSFRIGTFLKVWSSLTPEEKAAATDVCSLYKVRGYPIRLIQGELTNIKLTYHEDMYFAQAIIKNKD